jgi:hypothetical protein
VPSDRTSDRDGGPRSGFARLVFKLREGKTRWLRRRFVVELTTPTTRIGQWLHRIAGALLATALVPARLVSAKSAMPKQHSALVAFYDLRVAPITFDFLWFLAGADLRRRRLGLLELHVVIVPGPHHGVRAERDDYEEVIDPDARRWRIHNILIPACALLPVPCAITLTSSREQASALRSAAGRHVYPIGYETILPIPHHPSDCLTAARTENAPIAVLRSEGEALRAVDDWLKARGKGTSRLVTITLRGYSYMPARNSSLKDWVVFAEGLDPASFFVVFVPDTEQTLRPPLAELVKFPVFSEASWNIGLRMALYERAYLNLGVNGGPMGLCWLNAKTRYITFRMITDSVPQATAEYSRSLGFEIGASLPFATEFQKWLWEEDDSQAFIEREFCAMVDRIEASGQPATP